VRSPQRRHRQADYERRADKRRDARNSCVLTPFGDLRALPTKPSTSGRQATTGTDAWAVRDVAKVFGGRRLATREEPCAIARPTGGRRVGAWHPTVCPSMIHPPLPALILHAGANPIVRPS
jgi:hypothetical protein